jgi:hypothetical protein
MANKPKRLGLPADQVPQPVFNRKLYKRNEAGRIKIVLFTDGTVLVRHMGTGISRWFGPRDPDADGFRGMFEEAEGEPTTPADARYPIPGGDYLRALQREQDAHSQRSFGPDEADGDGGS